MTGWAHRHDDCPNCLLTAGQARHRRDVGLPPQLPGDDDGTRLAQQILNDLSGPPRPIPNPPPPSRHPWVLPLALTLAACALITIAATLAHT